MRLIDAKTLELREFIAPPEYAILSHTWGDQEVTFQEFTSPNPPRGRSGYQKIVQSCALMGAERANQKFLWVDTCCIDKTSSAELSESINSMFEWYRNATVCYAYLEDVSGSDPNWIEAFRNSRWWTRGWTLQELIAPAQVQFLSKEWKLLGYRKELATEISQITSIDVGLLRGSGDDRRRDLEGDLKRFSIAKRMSWAARRNTTRVEDIAYCLLGIFNIHMPLLYGEGKRAFLRLQEEIVRFYNDQSILAWESDDPGDWTFSPFASHPKAFEGTVDVTLAGPTRPMSLDASGLSVQVELDIGGSSHQKFAILQANVDADYLCRPAIIVDNVGGLEGTYRRALETPLLLLGPLPRSAGKADWYHVGFIKDGPPSDEKMNSGCSRINTESHRIVLAGSRSQTDLDGLALPPPLTFSILDQRRDTTTKRFQIKASVPPLTTQANIVPKASTFLPGWAEFAETDFKRYLICGALYLDTPEELGIVVIWGVVTTRQMQSRHLRRFEWWEERKPFVSFRVAEEINNNKDPFLTDSLDFQEKFHNLIYNWMERGPQKPGPSDAGNSAALGIGPDAEGKYILVSADAEKRKFVNRTAFHLTLKIEDWQGPQQ